MLLILKRFISYYTGYCFHPEDDHFIVNGISYINGPLRINMNAIKKEFEPLFMAFPDDEIEIMTRARNSYITRNIVMID